MAFSVRKRWTNFPCPSWARRRQAPARPSPCLNVGGSFGRPAGRGEPGRKRPERAGKGRVRDVRHACSSCMTVQGTQARNLYPCSIFSKNPYQRHVVRRMARKGRPMRKDEISLCAMSLRYRPKGTFFLSVHIFSPGKRNGAGNQKSVLFRMRKNSSRTVPEGYFLLE